MEFFEQHAALAASVMGLLVTLVGVLLLIAGRLYVKGNSRHQDWQDRRITALEEAAGRFSTQHGKFGVEIHHLGEHLKQLLEELVREREERREELDRERKDRKKAEEDNREDHQEIKGLILRGLSEAN